MLLAFATLTAPAAGASAAGKAAVSAPAISAAPDVVVGEADGHVDLPVTLNAPGTKAVTVNYATSNGGGCNNLDQNASGTLTFTPGETTKVVRIILNDCGVPGMGWFYLNLSAATNATIVDPSTLVGIVGDANRVATPELYVRDAVVDTSVGTVNIPVMLGGPHGNTSASTVTVKYSTTDGSALAGTDYTAEAGTLTFGPGQTLQNVSVPITNRSDAAPSRTFTVTLGHAVNATITDGKGVVRIGASGGTAVAAPRISAPPNSTVGEADGYVDLPVTLNAPGTKAVTVNYATSNGGGCNNLDQNASGTLTFTPGETTKVVRIILNDCGVSAGGEFTLHLSSAMNGIIKRADSKVTITGD